MARSHIAHRASAHAREQHEERVDWKPEPGRLRPYPQGKPGGNNAVGPRVPPEPVPGLELVG